MAELPVTWVGHWFSPGTTVSLQLSALKFCPVAGQGVSKSVEL